MASVKHARPQDGLLLSHVMSNTEYGIRRIEVRIGPWLAIGPEGLLESRTCSRRAEPGISIHVRRAKSGFADHGKRVIFLQK